MVISILLLFFCGCQAQETFETIGHVEQSAEIAEPWVMVCDLPSDAGKPVMESEDSGSLYFCDGYTLSIQTLKGGDLNRTFTQCTGFSKDSLQIMQTRSQGGKRYDAVWSAVGEAGDQVGRIAVLDDGNYHYVLMTMADASVAGELTESWQMLFKSAQIVDPQTLISSGS